MPGPTAAAETEQLSAAAQAAPAGGHREQPGLARDGVEPRVAGDGGPSETLYGQGGFAARIDRHQALAGDGGEIDSAGLR